MLLAQYWCQNLKAITMVLFITHKCTHTTGYHRLLTGHRQLHDLIIQRRVRAKCRQTLMRFCFDKTVVHHIESLHISAIKGTTHTREKSFFPFPFSEAWSLLISSLRTWSRFKMWCPGGILSTRTYTRVKAGTKN